MRKSVCVRERESVSAVSDCVSQLDKETVADHSSSAEGQMEERRARKVHSFILSFSILPFGPQKITSHLILGDKQLAQSAPSGPPCLCVCVHPACVLDHKCLPIDFSIKNCAAPHISTRWESLNLSTSNTHTAQPT